MHGQVPFNDLVVICTAIWCSFLKVHSCIHRSLFLGIEIHTRGIWFAEDFRESFLALMSYYNLLFFPCTDKMVSSNKLIVKRAKLRIANYIIIYYTVPHTKINMNYNSILFYFLSFVTFLFLFLFYFFCAFYLFIYFCLFCF